MSDSKSDETLAVLGRIEAFHGAVDFTLRQIMRSLEIHNEKLDAVLLAATREPGPSPVAEALEKIVSSLDAQTELLTALPEALGRTIREELERDAELDDLDMEPAELGAFDGSADA